MPERIKKIMNTASGEKGQSKRSKSPHFKISPYHKPGRLRREPKSLKDFVARFKPIVSTMISNGVLEHGNELVRETKSLLHEKTGEGQIFLFPLTQAAPEYHLIKGVLKVIAPKARAVTIASPSSQEEQFSYVDSKPLQKSLERFARARRLTVIDAVTTGRTCQRISTALKAMRFQGELDLPFEPEYMEPSSARLWHLANHVTGSIKPFAHKEQYDSYYKMDLLGFTKNAEGKIENRGTMKRLAKNTNKKNVKDPEKLVKNTRKVLAIARQHYYYLGIALARDYQAKKADKNQR